MGCCVGDCGFCCIANCGFCCILDFGGGCCVGDSSSPSSSVDHAKEVADELAALCDRADKIATEDEENILKTLNLGIGSFLNMVEEINKNIYGGRSLNINIKGIREKKEKLENDVKGYIGRRLRDRLVLTDKEVSVIIREKDKSERKKNFEEFFQKIVNDAREGLSEKIAETSQEQRDIVTSAIKQRLWEVNQGMERLEMEYRNLVEAHRESARAVESRKLEYLFQLDDCGMMIDEIKKAHRILSE